jgi:type II secretory pathway component HofQ
MFTMRCVTITGFHFYVNIRLHDYDIRQLEQQIREIQIQDKIQALKDSINYNEKLKLIEKPYFTSGIKIIVQK